MTPGGRFSHADAARICERAGFRCERCGASCLGTRGVNWSIQHRKARGMGGTRRVVTLADGALLCGSATTGCHGWAESHPAEAAYEGWRVPQSGDPNVVPIKHQLWGWSLLGSDGGYYRSDPPATEAPNEA